MRMFLAMVAVLLLPGLAVGQVVLEAYEEVTGVVESVSPGIIVVKGANGAAQTYRIQDKQADSLALSGGIVVQYPASVKVTGQLKPTSLQLGQAIRFTAMVSRAGKTAGEIASLALAEGGDVKLGITPKSTPKTGTELVECQIVAEFGNLSNNRLAVKIPQGTFVPKKSLSFALAENAVVEFASNDFRRAPPGAKVTKLVAAKFSTGDRAVQELEITASADIGPAAARIDDKLVSKYRHLSDEPSKPRQVRSQHFLLVTDVSDRQAQILLDKLETMVGLLSAYFGRAPTAVAEGFVVRDLSGWPDGVLKEPEGVAKIREGAGICFSRSLGLQRQSIFYTCDDHGVTQHEATHAICHLTFGSTGPTWLAEGVAEMGQYWKADQLAVDISPVVISYIQSSKPRQLRDIAIHGRTESGTWQDYAWRWALCHLLATNPNYADRFKPLAIALMEEREGVTFASAYGEVAPQISFEYDQFLKQLDNGYRADLCAWPWRAKFKPLRDAARVQVEIRAGHGWQASGVEVEQGVSYDVAAIGQWAIAGDGAKVTGAGDQSGRGALVGVLFHEFALSEPFDIGARKTFVAPSAGQLFLRCKDDWNKLADNSGELTVHVRRTPAAP